VEATFTIEGPITDLTLSAAQAPSKGCVPGNDGILPREMGDGQEVINMNDGVTPGTVVFLYHTQFKFENLTPGTYNVCLILVDVLKRTTVF
jgi:hypothetical protein